MKMLAPEPQHSKYFGGLMTARSSGVFLGLQQRRWIVYVEEKSDIREL